jgi:hypothetical protein
VGREELEDLTLPEYTEDELADLDKTQLNAEIAALGDKSRALPERYPTKSIGAHRAWAELAHRPRLTAAKTSSG